jgi:hypothetical protein
MTINYIEFTIEDINEEFKIHWDALFWKYLFKKLDFGGGINFDFLAGSLLADSSLFDDDKFTEKLQTIIKNIQERGIDKKYYERFSG